MAPKSTPPAPKGGSSIPATRGGERKGDTEYAAWQQQKAQERKCGNCGTTCSGCFTCPSCGQWVGGD